MELSMQFSRSRKKKENSHFGQVLVHIFVNRLWFDDQIVLSGTRINGGGANEQSRCNFYTWLRITMLVRIEICSEEVVV